MVGTQILVGTGILYRGWVLETTCGVTSGSVTILFLGDTAVKGS